MAAGAGGKMKPAPINKNVVMKKVRLPDNVRPISVYNCEAKELIGVFSRVTYAAKWLFPLSDLGLSRSKINSCLKTNGTMFEFKVAVRYANQEKKAILSDSDWWIADGYPPVDKSRMKGFTSTRAELKKEHADRK